MSTEYHGNLAGPGSKYRVAIWFRVDESRSTDEKAYVQWGAALQVTSGDFYGTIVTSSWDDNITINDEGEYGWSGYGDCGLVGYGDSIVRSAEAYYVSYSGITYSSSCSARYYPSTPTWQPYDVSGVSATRSSDTRVTVKWTNHKATARPYSGIYVDRQVDGGDWSLIKDCGGSATSFTDTTTSANHVYRYRVIPHNGAGNAPDNVYSGYVYTTPAAPMAIGISQPSKSSTGVNIAITTANSASKTASKTIVQYRSEGGSWSNVGEYTYSDTVNLSHNPGNGKWQYKARNFGNGLYSGWYLSAVVEVSSLESPTSVVATNEYDSTDMVDNTKMKVEIKANGQSTDHPRAGFNMYIREVIPSYDEEGRFEDMTVGDRPTSYLMSWADASKTAIDTTKEVTSWGSFSNMAGRCRIFTVASYYSTAISADTYSKWIYGRLVKPKSLSVGKVGNKITAYCDADSNVYPYMLKYGFKTSSDSDYEWFDYYLSESAFSMTSSKYAINDISVAVKAVPDLSSGLCQDMSSVAKYISEVAIISVKKSPRPIDSEKIAVISGSKTDPEYNKKIQFPIATNGSSDEFATSYELYVYKDGVQTYSITIQATNPESGMYETEFINMASDDTVEIVIKTVYAYSDVTYVSEDSICDYTYEPTPLTAPEIVDVTRLSINSNIYRVMFRASTGGRPYINETYSQEGYKYTVYIDSDVAINQSPSSSVIVCDKMKSSSTGYNYIDIPIISSKTVYIRMVASDKRNISQVSNSMRVRYTITDVNVFVYGEGVIKIDECILEGMAYPLKIGGGAKVSVENSTLKLPSVGGHYYDVDESSEIFEVNNKYE